MNRTILLLALALSAPALSQPVYKCPQPDGSIVRQESLYVKMLLGNTKDPFGVHAWLERNDQDQNPIL